MADKNPYASPITDEPVDNSDTRPAQEVPTPDRDFETMSRKKARGTGVVIVLGAAFMLGLNWYEVATKGAYYPKGLLIGALLLPIGLWLVLVPGEVEAASGRRPRWWQAGFVACAAIGIIVGFSIYYRLGGLSWLGFKP